MTFRFFCFWIVCYLNFRSTGSNLVLIYHKVIYSRFPFYWVWICIASGIWYTTCVSTRIWYHDYDPLPTGGLNQVDSIRKLGMKSIVIERCSSASQHGVRCALWGFLLVTRFSGCLNRSLVSYSEIQALRASNLVSFVNRLSF